MTSLNLGDCAGREPGKDGPRIWRSIACAMLWYVVAVPHEALSQSLIWRNGATFYGDNTEFFNPYRIGQTILGAQMQTYLSAEPGPRTEVVLGVFSDHRSGRSDFFDEVKPLLGFRYRTATSLGALGSLVTEKRHGYLEPLQVTTLELTRPVEYGGQWREEHGWVGGEIFIDWQHLNTKTSREIFDYGLLLHLRPLSFLNLEFQSHGLHHGGQLYGAGEPVTNNQVFAFGGRATRLFPLVGVTSLGFFHLTSHGRVRPMEGINPPDQGSGTYVRGSVVPLGFVELFTIQWWGRDFLSEEGDNSYNSRGTDPSYYRSRRRYQEYGLARQITIESGVTLDTELRFHRYDHLRSIALGHSGWEYSYHLVVRAPFDVPLGGKER
jgi:hypothetical protein